MEMRRDRTEDRTGWPWLGPANICVFRALCLQARSLCNTTSQPRKKVGLGLSSWWEQPGVPGQSAAVERPTMNWRWWDRFPGRGSDVVVPGRNSKSDGGKKVSRRSNSVGDTEPQEMTKLGLPSAPLLLLSLALHQEPGFLGLPAHHLFHRALLGFRNDSGSLATCCHALCASSPSLSCSCSLQLWVPSPF